MESFANSSASISELPPFRGLLDNIKIFLLIIILLFDIFNDFRGNPAGDGECGYIFCYHSACCDYRMISNCDSGHNCGVRADPDAFSDVDRGGMHGSPVFGRKIMVESCDHHIMANQSLVANKYASLILKMAAGINKYMFSDGYIFSIVGIERRKKCEGSVYVFCCQFFH